MWVVVVGAVYFVLYYIIFRFMISKFDYKTPGRDDAEEVKLYTRAVSYTHLPSRNSSPLQKTVKNCCPIYKKPPRTPPQWEESSTVFVYQVCCSLRTSFCTAFYFSFSKYAEPIR